LGHPAEALGNVTVFRRAVPRLFALALASAALAAATACSGGGGGQAGPVNTGPVNTGVITHLVATTVTRVVATATASGKTATLSPSLRADVVPLLAARTFVVHQPLAQYGLDHPVADLVFFQGAAVVERMDVGGPDFDAHGFYVQRAGDPAVYLVLTASMRPVLTALGIATPPPS
jgi:hypothetical protein